MEKRNVNTNLVAALLVVIAVLGYGLIGRAGNLEPSAPPGSTMKTLDEVEPRIPIRQADIPLTISTPGSYYATGNLAADGHGILIVDCNNVTIDLMGYTLSGTGTLCSTGIALSTNKNVKICNGTVRDFDMGITGAVGSATTSVINVQVLSNSSYGILLNGDGGLIKDCVVADNGARGVTPPTHAVVTSNAVHNNKEQGIYCSLCLIKDNTVNKNGIGGDYEGIYAGTGSVVTNNVACWNGGAGIHCYSNSVITSNIVKDNNKILNDTGAGIKVNSDCLVKNNTANENSKNNIYVGANDNAIEENLVTDSDGNGLKFFMGGNFYANNRASGNGTNYNDPGGNTNGGGNAAF